MKMKKNDYDTLKRFIKNTISNTCGLEKLEILYKDKGLSKMRLRWDVFYASKIRIGDGIGLKDGDIIDPDLNMDHIDTALRKIFKHKKGE